MRSRTVGIFLSYVNTAVNMLCGLFLSSYLLRTLGDTEYGIYQSVASFANYLVLLQFGTGSVMTRNVAMCVGRNAEKAEIDRNTATIWTVSCAMTGLVLVVSVIFYSSIGTIYRATMTAQQIAYAKEIFVLVAGFLVVSFMMQTISGITLAYDRYAFASLRSIIRNVIRTAALILLLSYSKRAILIAHVDLWINLILFLATLLYCKKNFHICLSIRMVDWKILRDVAPFCFAMFLQTIVNQVNNNVDKFLISIKLSPESVSLYSVGMYIYTVFSSLTTIPISMYAPMVAKRIAAGADMDSMGENLITPCRMTAIIGGLVLFGFVAVGRPFICVLYGEKYLQAWLIALIIMGPMYLTMVNGVLVNVLDALNKRIVRSLSLLATSAANVVLTIFWLDRWGCIGAAVATGVCTMIGQVVLMNVYYSRGLKIPVMYLFCKAFRGVLGCLLLSCGVSLMVTRLISGALMSFLVGGVTFVGTFAVLYLIFGISEKEKSVLIQKLRRRK